MSRRGSRSPFEAIQTQGGLLPHDLLQRIAARDPKLPGMKDAEYGLLEHEREGEVVNRAWTRLLAAWANFRAALEKEPPDAHAVKLTRERWLLPLFQALDFGRLSSHQPFDIDGRLYPISHAHEATHTAIHLLGARVSLDVKTQAVQGAAKTTPHGLMQDFLNRSAAHDWAIVTNGLVLRLLRDSKSITRQAYVEFDLEAILDDERYSEFRVLWLVCHESRFRRDGENTCLLEQWFERGKEEGVRALDRLRGGVEEAIRALGRGFLRRDRNNSALHDALASGSLDAHEYYRQLLRLVYRLIFLFVTEDRAVLLDPAAPAAARERYTRYYATSHLRALSTRRRGGPHGDQWTRLKLVMDRLYGGCSELGLPALGSFLWRPEAIGLLGKSALANEDLLSAVRMLVEVSDGRVVMPVAWSQVGADELGSVYESLLELHPRIEREAGAFELGTAAGHERKTTGSYYTPTSLVECLLESSLDPALDAKCRSSNPEAAILEMRVCDPACGSGHFLVAAARRIARRLAAVRSGDEEPSPEAMVRALRDVVGRCIFGVDLNSMAVELCKISLWLEAIEPGRPLSFLDGHIQCGDSILGATPALIANGIPDEAFEALEGDDKEVAKRLRRLNREEREQRSLPFSQAGPSERLNVLAARVEAVDRESDASLQGVERKLRLWDELHASEDFRRALFVADAWCTAFVWPKVAGAPEQAAVTQDVLRRLAAGEQLASTAAEIVRLRKIYSFLHWHLAFPQVFSLPGPGEVAERPQAGWSGGFDCVIGNPPWDALLFREQEYFAERRPQIANAGTAAARKRLIARLSAEDPPLDRLYRAALRRVDGANVLVRASGRFPLCGVGRVNLFALFAETARQIASHHGRVGQLVPSGIVTDDSTKSFFQTVMDNNELASFYDFENREGLFPAVDSRLKFGIISLRSGRAPDAAAASFAFFATRVEHVASEERRFALTPADIAQMNPATRTCPIFRSRRDAEVNKSIYRRVPVLTTSGWDLKMRRLLNSADDSGSFSSERGEDMLPLYEAKYFHHYDHRWVTHAGSVDRELTPEERSDPHFFISPRHWYPASDVAARFGADWSRPWVLAWRDIARSTDERTFIASIVPSLAVPHTAKVIFPPSKHIRHVPCLIANLGALAFDYLARQKIGGTHMSSFIVEQLPVLGPDFYESSVPWQAGQTLEAWLTPRVVELTYHTWDLQSFAEDCGHEGPPFWWNPDRRFHLRCELDAAYFHLYGLSRDEVSFVLDTFPIVRRNDEARHGEFRTGRVILEVFDRMAEAIRSNQQYETRLTPPPADPSVAHTGEAPTKLAKSATARPATSTSSFTTPSRRKPRAGGSA